MNSVNTSGQSQGFLVPAMTQDDALTIGLGKYREYFPPGKIPRFLEDAAVLTQIPGKEETTVLITFDLRGEKKPFVLFRAAVSRDSGEVRVEQLSDWHELLGRDLDNSTSM
jgi:hypothetical protein